MFVHRIRIHTHTRTYHQGDVPRKKGTIGASKKERERGKKKRSEPHKRIKSATIFQLTTHTAPAHSSLLGYSQRGSYITWTASCINIPAELFSGEENKRHQVQPIKRNQRNVSGGGTWKSTENKHLNNVEDTGTGRAHHLHGLIKHNPISRN